jgi:hypothetical protein
MGLFFSAMLQIPLYFFLFRPLKAQPGLQEQGFASKSRQGGYSLFKVDLLQCQRKLFSGPVLGYYHSIPRPPGRPLWILIRKHQNIPAGIRQTSDGFSIF